MKVLPHVMRNINEFNIPTGNSLGYEILSSPQVSIVWVGLDGDEIVCAHLNLYKKLKNIQRDARVALSMATGGKTNGLDNYLVINGHARITGGGAPELVNRLAQIYLAPGTTFIPDDAPEGYILYITAERVYGIGSWNE